MGIMSLDEPTWRISLRHEILGFSNFPMSITLISFSTFSSDFNVSISMSSSSPELGLSLFSIFIECYLVSASLILRNEVRLY